MYIKRVFTRKQPRIHHDESGLVALGALGHGLQLVPLALVLVEAFLVMGMGMAVIVFTVAIMFPRVFATWAGAQERHK